MIEFIVIVLATSAAVLAWEAAWKRFGANTGRPTDGNL